MKKFISKPRNLVSLILAVLGLVGILVMLIVPHGAKYTNTTTLNDEKIVSCIELKDGKLYSSTKADGEWTDEIAIGEYSISKGKLSYKLGGVSVEVGKINAFRIKIADAEDNTATCKMTVVFFAIACVMTVVGATGLVLGATSKSKKKK